MKKLFFLILLMLAIPTASALTFDQACRSPLHGYQSIDNFTPARSNTAYIAGPEVTAPGVSFGTSEFNNEAIGYIDRLSGSGKVPLNNLRLNNASFLDDFYTIDPQQVNEAINIHGFSDVGDTGFVSQNSFSGALPIYRLYHPTRVDHAYTSSITQRNMLVNDGYTFERIEGYLWPSPNKIPLINGLSNKIFCFSNGTFISNDIAAENRFTTGIISTAQAGPNDIQTYQFTVNTKDYFDNRAGDHMAIFTWGFVTQESSGNFTAPVYGRGLAIGNTTAVANGCNGAVIEYWEGTSSQLIANTCSPFTFASNTSFTVWIETTLFSIRYRMIGNGQDTGWVSTTAAPDASFDPSGRTNVYSGATNHFTVNPAGPAHLEVVNNSVTIESLLPPPDPECKKGVICP